MLNIFKAAVLLQTVPHLNALYDSASSQTSEPKATELPHSFFR